MAYEEFTGKLDSEQGGGYVEFTGQLDKPSKEAPTQEPSSFLDKAKRFGSEVLDTAGKLASPVTSVLSPAQGVPSIQKRLSAASVDPVAEQKRSDANIDRGSDAYRTLENKLKLINPEAASQPDWQSFVDYEFNRQRNAKPVDDSVAARSKEYVSQGYGQDDATQNAQFDKRLQDERMNAGFAKREADPVTGERIRQSYRPELEAQRVADEQAEQDRLSKVFRERRIDQLRQQDANENPISSSIAAGLASTLLAANAVPAAINTVSQGLGFGDVVGKIPMTDDVARVVGASTPESARLSIEDAYKQGKLGEMLLTNVASQSPQYLLKAMTLVAPEIAPITLPFMGAMSAGSSYTGGDSAAASVLKGSIEAGSELIDIKLLNKFKDRLASLPLPYRTTLVQALGRKVAQAAGITSVVSAGESIEEGASQVGQNIVDKYIQHKDVGLLDDVAKSMLVGAVASGVVAGPVALNVAQMPASKEQAAARVLADSLNAGLVDDTAAVTEFANRNYTTSGNVRPEATSQEAARAAAVQAERAKFEEIRAINKAKADAGPANVLAQTSVDGAIQAAMESSAAGSTALDASLALNLPDMAKPVIPMPAAHSGLNSSIAGVNQTQATSDVENAIKSAIPGIDQNALLGRVNEQLGVQPSAQNVTLTNDGTTPKVTARVNPTGTLTVLGNIEAAIQILRDAGITHVLPSAEGLVVSKGQAERAKLAVEAAAPADSSSLKQVLDITGRPPASWVFRNKETGEAVMETDNPNLVAKLNTDKYEAVPIGEHLAGINREIKAQQGVQNSAQSTQAEPTGPRFYGIDSQPMDDGGKPFKSQAEAKKAQKLQPQLRVKKVKGGFALTEKTAKQLAAEAQAAKRLGAIGTGGKPLAVHEFLASMGGLSKSTMSDLGFDKNLKLGAKYLFTNAGMSLERAVEALGQYGYMQGTNQNEALTLIQKSAKGQPQYTPEGWEAIAQAEAEARFADHLQAQQEAMQDEEFDPFTSLEPDGFTMDDADESGYDQASSDIKAEVSALMEHAASLDIDTEAIVERAAQDTENQSDQAYYERTKQLIQDAIQASTGSRSNATDTGENSFQGREDAEPTGRGDRSQDDGSEGEQGAEDEGLTAKNDDARSAEQKIRDEFNQGSVRLGVAKPITITHNGVVQQFMARQDRLANGKSHATIHLNRIKRGRLYQGLDSEWLIESYKLTGKNDLVEEGLPKPISEDEAQQFLANFDVLSAPTEADVLSNQSRAENADALDEREQIRRESEAGAGSFQLQAQDGRVDDTGFLFSRKASPVRSAINELVAAQKAWDDMRGDGPNGVTIEQYMALTDRSLNAKKALVSELSKLPDDGFALQADASGGRYLILTPSAQQPGRWQLTRFSPDGTPWGDTNYDTKNQAVREFIEEADLETIATGEGLKFSRGAKPVKNLVTLHNMTEANLAYADSMGGMPVPSLGITKVDSPFSGFGDITLIGDKNMVDPEAGVPVFDRDAWTARFPTMNFKKVKSAKADAFYERFKPAKTMADDGDQFMSMLWDEMVNRKVQTPDGIADLFKRYNAAKVFYAKEVLGKDIKTPTKPYKPQVSVSDDAQVRAYYKRNRDALEGYDSVSMEDHQKALREFEQIVDAAVDRVAAQVGDRAEVRAKMMRSSLFDEDGYLNGNMLRAIFKDQAKVGTKVLDSLKLREVVQKAVPDNDPAYLRWVRDQVAPLFDAPTITLRGREVAPTLDNLVEAMTVGATQGAEKSMTFGAGKLAAHLGKRFKSLAEIQDARDQVVSQQQEGEAKKATDQLLEEYRTHVTQFFTGKDYRGNIDTWAANDASMEALAKAGKVGMSDGAIRASLQSKGFKGLDQKSIDMAREVITALRNAQTDYFEAKPQRAVKLSEFNGAVAPKSISPEALAILEKNGLQVELYGKGEGAREKAIAKMAKRLDKVSGDVLYSQSGQKTEPAFTPDQLRAAAKKTHGNLLEQGEKKGLVKLAGMDELIDQAAKDRAEVTGGDWQEIKKSILKSVQNSRTAPGTANFDRWFGDSKVVDAEGKPLVVYHGTAADVTFFDPLALGANTDVKSAKGGFFFAASPKVASGYAMLSETRPGLRSKVLRNAAQSDVLSPDLQKMLLEAAETFTDQDFADSLPIGEKLTESATPGANVLPVYLSIQNPLVVDYEGNDYRERTFNYWIKEAKNNGNDGVIFRNAEDSMHKDYAEVTDIFVAFSPTKIKSAIGNNGNYDPSDLDIRRSANGDINGFHDPKTGKSYLNADSLTPDTVGPVMIHELWHAANVDGAMDAVNNRALTMIKAGKGNPFFDDVAKMMAEAGETSAEEASAYLVQKWEQDTINSPQPVKRWVKNLVAAVRAWLFNKGILLRADQLTEADIAAVARMLAKEQVMSEPSFVNDGATPDQQKFEKSSAFWRWYSGADGQDQRATGTGNSATSGQSSSSALGQERSGPVDSDGNPVVFYHGTRDDIESFDIYHPNRKDFGWLGRGVYGVSDPEIGERYASMKRGSGSPRIMPLYFAVTNPYQISLATKNKLRYASQAYIDEFTKKVKALGHDGVTLTYDDGTVEIVAFEPTQVKSAIGNNGNYDPNNPDIRFSRGQRQGNLFAGRFNIDEETKLQAFQRKMQDHFNRVKVVQDLLREQGGNIDEASDVYRAEERMHGIVQEKMVDLRDQVLEPLMKKAAHYGIDLDELALYAYAKHAQERNSHIQGLRSDMPDNGSGMTDTEAQDILDDVARSGKQSQYDELQRVLMRINQMRQDVQLQSGLISQEEYDAWRNQYQDYVPLRGFEAVNEEGKISDQGKGTGRKFNIRGKESMRALGRQTRAADIIENIITDYQTAVVRSEKNMVLQRFLKLVMDNPDPSLWEIDAVKTRDSFDRSTGKVSSGFVVDKGPDTVGLKVNGREIYLKIHDDVLARALRGPEDNGAAQTARMITNVTGHYLNLLRNTITRFNPEFALTNLERDLGMAVPAVIDELGEKGGVLFAKYYPGATAASAASLLGKLNKMSPEWNRYFMEYRMSGGTTGGFYVMDADELRSDLRMMMLSFGAKPKTTYERMVQAAQKVGLRKAGNVLEFLGSTSEHAARVAAFRAAREMGKTPAQAAAIAKNLTTNFNRKGEWGGLVNSLYLFANANIQGNARLFKMLKNRKMLPYFAGMTGAMAALAMLNAGIGGDDDDGESYWDKIPQYIKERNIVIMLPPGVEMDGAEQVGKKGRYVTIAAPFGLNTFSNLGYELADIYRHIQNPLNGHSVGRAAWNMTSGVVAALNPLNGSFDSKESALLTILPTVFDLPAQFIMGVDAFGKPVAPRVYDEDSIVSSENVNARQSGGPAHMLARWINKITGGDEETKGAIDMTPGTIENAARTATGGTGKFIYDSIALAVKAFDDEPDIFVKEVPFVRRAYGEVDGDVEQGQLYERRAAINEAKAEVHRKGLAGKEVTNAEVIAKAAMSHNAGEITKSLSKIRRELIEIKQDETLSNAEKQSRERELKRTRDELVTAFNQMWREVMESYQKGEFDQK